MMRTLFSIEAWWMIALYVGLSSFSSYPIPADAKKARLDGQVAETWYEDEHGKRHGLETSYDFGTGQPRSFTWFEHGEARQGVAFNNDGTVTEWKR